MTTLESKMTVHFAQTLNENRGFVEHWDELNLLKVFQQIGAVTVRKPEGQ